jgi:hypothetical protein
MTITFVIGAFVIGAFLLVPLGILVAFALIREPRPPSSVRPGDSAARAGAVDRHEGAA